MMNGLTSEEYLAGAILIEEQTIQLVRGIVRRDDFQSTSCGAIFSAASSLAAEGEVIDPVAIQNRARREDEELSNEFIVNLMSCVPTAANCRDYAYRVAEDARKRRVKDLAVLIQEDGTSTSDELLAVLLREAEAIRGTNFQRGLLSPGDALRQFMDHVVEAGKTSDNFVSSGYPQLDEILGGGFIRGGLYILGARPAVGKSTFAINLADNIRGGCLFVSLEMSPKQITAKRVSRHTGISSAKLLAGKVDGKEWEAIGMATCTLSERKLYMNNRYDLAVPQIQLLAQGTPQLRAVIVDYLGLVQSAKQGGSLYEAVSMTSRELKRMALSLDVPVICLAQLSRQVENREDKRPRLSDLRDSGSIEQDADAVMFLYRPDYYTGPPEDGTPSLVQLEVAKNRHGRTGETQFNFWLQASTFKEIT